MWSRKHLIDIDSFSRKDFEYVFELTDKLLPYSGINKLIRTHPLYVAQSRIMTLWFEPEYEKSTRTFGSFQGAMMRLGGLWKEFNEQSSSMGKGESVEDTARILSQHSDIIIDRHRDPEHVHKVARYSDVPVINGGNGSYQHPTQTILDLYTIRKKRKIDGTRIAIVGDLKNGRPVHSICRGIDVFEDVSLIGLYPPGHGLPESYLPRRYESAEISCAGQLKKGLLHAQPDVVYVTRPQRERGYDGYEYCIDSDVADTLPKHSLIMHPLPKTSEISREIDDDPRAVYFEQASYGVPTRMAIISIVLDLDGLIRRDY